MTATASLWLEGLMLVCFGTAWPVANLRMLRRRRPEGKGPIFTAIVLTGYLAGALAKLLPAASGAPIVPVFWLYVVNACSVALNLALQQYFARASMAAP